MPRSAGNLDRATLEEAWRAAAPVVGPKEKKKNKVACPPWTLWEVPCRACSERAQQEVRWPLRCFTADITQTAIWSKISEGQRLQCYRCYHSTRAPKDTRLMMCGECGDLLRRSRFSGEMQKKWDTGALDAAVLCTQHKVPAAEPTKQSKCFLHQRGNSRRRQRRCARSVGQLGLIVIFPSRKSS